MVAKSVAEKDAKKAVSLVCSKVSELDAESAVAMGAKKAALKAFSMDAMRVVSTDAFQAAELEFLMAAVSVEQKVDWMVCLSAAKKVARWVDQ